MFNKILIKSMGVSFCAQKKQASKPGLHLSALIDSCEGKS